MCGICGIINYSGGEPEEKIIKRMCSNLTHRGPDDEGVYVERKEDLSVGLGHRRLSIIDLSALGHQPMSNEDGKVWLVFNGEIYNYRDLKPEMESRGHKFNSDTDSEVIIHLYEEYAEGCVNFLRGMFAFAVWDARKGLLFLARDRIGKKPLVYYYDNDVFCFASELSALLSSGLVQKDINNDAISYYLSLGYVPAPLSIYNKVFKLPPGHTLVFRKGEVSLRQYWNLDYSSKLSISEHDASIEVMRILKEATKIRMHSDVPLGAFLSGGIDSSVVVALMSQLSTEKVKTFSIGFEDNDYNELPYARNIAKVFDTEHHEFIVKPDAVSILPLLVERYGEPYADSSCIPTFYVAQQTKKFVTVALNGDGGDESFAGYDRYQAMRAADIYQAAPSFIRRSICAAANAVLPDSTNFSNRSRRMKRFFNSALLNRHERYLKWVSVIDLSLQDKIYSDDFSRQINIKASLGLIKDFMLSNQKLSLLDSVLYTDVKTYLPYDLLVKVDIASMANSLEVRSPFLDHKLMEFAAQLPTRYKMKNLIKKYLLKKSIEGFIPRENVYRKKMGFGVPVGRWFRGELKSYLCDIILSVKSLKRGYFKPRMIKEMVIKHIENKADHTFQLWALLMLELWHQRFIDR